MPLSYMDDELTLDVRDDEVGFDPGAVGPPAQAGGVGTLGMRQRALRRAGEVVVESEPAAGTAVSLRTVGGPCLTPLLFGCCSSTTTRWCGTGLRGDVRGLGGVRGRRRGE